MADIRAFESLGIKVDGVSNIDDTKPIYLGNNKPSDSEKEEPAIKPQVFFLSKEDELASFLAGLVPDAYRSATYSTAKIKENLSKEYAKNKYFKVARFKQYNETICNILTTLRAGQLPSRSYLIGSPNGFGKTSFANEAIKIMFKQGFFTVPYISLVELSEIMEAEQNRLMTGGSFNRYSTKIQMTNDIVGENLERKYEKNLIPAEEYAQWMYTDAYSYKGTDLRITKSPQLVTGRFSFSEYINADCLFVYFTSPTFKIIESNTLKTLLNIRGVKGKPTIVMISDSLDLYTSNKNLRDYVWSEIMATDEDQQVYDRLYHVSCFKKVTDSPVMNEIELE